MTDAAQALLEEMKTFVATIPFGEEKVLPTDYADRVRAVGETTFLAKVFQSLTDAELSSWMVRLAFWWKNLSFEDWKKILRVIGEDRNALYQFVWFAAEALAMDTGAMLAADPMITAKAHAVFGTLFPHGASPSWDSPWWTEMLEERGIDRQNLIERLASEGAPIAPP